ncbi:MAG TPA: LamG domain-containing protein [Gammaproteobacteria bacterium]
MRDKINKAAIEHTKKNLSRHMMAMMVLSLSVILSACGDNPQSEINNGTGGGVTYDPGAYKGPAPATQDIQAFKIEFWDNLSGSNRCGTCHGNDGQAPMFVFQDDINVAYSNAITVVDLINPASSVIVSKVAQGHNCWLGATAAGSCATIIENYITAWLGGSGDGSGRTINLTAPVIKDPGSSKNFPATALLNGSNSFANTVHPLLRDNCANCHSETSATPQSPFFANTDVNTAYEAAKAKMDLDTPANSRFVLRLDQEFHNCWSSDCGDDAADMQAAINAFSSAIQLTQVDPSLVTSKALALSDGIIASGGSRSENNLIALWEFKTGTGSVAYDTSGVEPALDLTFSGAVDWVLGYGIEIITGKAQGSTANSKKLHDFIKASGEYSIEAWVVPGNVTQEGRSIITYSGGGTTRNFTMGQSLYNYDFINLSDRTDGTTMSKLMTDDADEDLQASLQHVVMNFDPVNGRQIYVNGVYTDDMDADPEKGGSLAGWNNNFALVLGNEPGASANTLWKGKLRLVAIHNRALTQDQILQNLAVGVGQKYMMLFSVADRIGIPDSYIMFEVEQFDNNAYLFNAPKFINLDPAWTPSSSIAIKGMRIGVNGREAIAGQMYGNMDVTVNSGDYTANGQLLSDLGTIIALEKGPEADEFFLTFEQLGSNTNFLVEQDPVAPQSPPDAEAVSDIGVRTFDEINATMSAITGIPVTQAGVKSTFDSYRRQLPAVEDVQAYLSSHQMAVAQLAMKYCDVLVTTNPGFFATTRAPYAGSFNFNQAANIAFDDAGKARILDPLLTAAMNIDLADNTNNLQTHPGETDIRNMLSSSTVQNLDATLNNDDYQSLIACMTTCGINGAGSPRCEAYVKDDNVNQVIDPAELQCTSAEASNHSSVTHTSSVVKAVCTATLGSAMMLIQ